MHFSLYSFTTEKAFFCFQIGCIWGKVSCCAPGMAERREIQTSHVEKLFLYLFFLKYNFCQRGWPTVYCIYFLETWILITQIKVLMLCIRIYGICSTGTQCFQQRRDTVGKEKKLKFHLYVGRSSVLKSVPGMNFIQLPPGQC